MHAQKQPHKIIEATSYCEDLFNYKRNQTVEVKVGNLAIGGSNPISIQSMTTTNTLDAEATAAQVMSILDAGGDIVRITTQGRREASNLKLIRDIIRQKGYAAPLVADIHFNPNAAEIAATLVEKVRINPGNFSGGAKKFELNYSDEAYNEELEDAKRKVKSFLRICLMNHTAIRIGTNHGSLSDRIMSRFGDTPEGMVEACMEYLRICREVDFKDIVLSIKASNTRIMVHTVRLLVASMKAENMSFPLHLGVTEAGSEDEGRIKSAVGSGALLADGLGDTIRVSLTEDPEKEVPVAKKLVDYLMQRANHEPILSTEVHGFTPFEYNRRKTNTVLNIGGQNVPVVIGQGIANPSAKVPQPDYFYCETKEEALNHAGMVVLPLAEWLSLGQRTNAFPLLSVGEYLATNAIDGPRFLKISLPELTEQVLNKLRSDISLVLFIYSRHINSPIEQRALLFKLNQNELAYPVILMNEYNEPEVESFQIKSAADAGILFLDGFADGLFLINKGRIDSSVVVNTSFGILQAARARFSKTEFISCPGCGRTLFDLQNTTREIKEQTSHLKGLKIGVMGCIVNGVGEMADADYGYIGSGPDKVSLFKNRELVIRNLPGGKPAVEALIKLIKENGDWVDPN